MTRRALHLAIAGGPMAGKTHLAPQIAQQFRDNGYRVIRAPEMATWLYTSGIDDVADIATNRRHAYLKLQGLLGLGLRDIRLRINEMCEALDEDIVVLSERGELDLLVYLEREEALKLLADAGLTVQDLYADLDCVLYLETGAGHDANLASNPARREQSLEAAFEAEARTWAVWGEHPQTFFVPARSDFYMKAADATKSVDAIIRMHSKQLDRPTLGNSQPQGPGFINDESGHRW